MTLRWTGISSPTLSLLGRQTMKHPRHKTAPDLPSDGQRGRHDPRQDSETSSDTDSPPRSTTTSSDWRGRRRWMITIVTLSCHCVYLNDCSVTNYVLNQLCYFQMIIVWIKSHDHKYTFVYDHLFTVSGRGSLTTYKEPTNYKEHLLLSC